MHRYGGFLKPVDPQVARAREEEENRKRVEARRAREEEEALVQEDAVDDESPSSTTTTIVVEPDEEEEARTKASKTREPPLGVRLGVVLFPTLVVGLFLVTRELGSFF